MMGQVSGRIVRRQGFLRGEDDGVEDERGNMSSTHESRYTEGNIRCKMLQPADQICTVRLCTSTLEGYPSSSS